MIAKPLTVNHVAHELLRLFAGVSFEEKQCLMMNKNTSDKILFFEGLPSTKTDESHLSIFGMPVLIANYIPDDAIGITEHGVGVALTLINSQQHPATADMRRELSVFLVEPGLYRIHGIDYVVISADEIDGLDINGHLPDDPAFDNLLNDLMDPDFEGRNAWVNAPAWGSIPKPLEMMPLDQIDLYDEQPTRTDVYDKSFLLENLKALEDSIAHSSSFVFTMSIDTAKNMGMNTPDTIKGPGPIYSLGREVVFNNAIPVGVIGFMSQQIAEIIEKQYRFASDNDIREFHIRLGMHTPIWGMFIYNGNVYLKLKPANPEYKANK